MEHTLSPILLRLKRGASLLTLTFLVTVSFTSKVSAHCPLCTIGIAAAAGSAAFLGVKTTVIGLFVGAFAFSMGSWIGNIKGYVKYQKLFLGWISYIITILPLAPLTGGVLPVYISIAGDYGSVLNRTYLLNGFVVGSLIGVVAAMTTPWISEEITKIRDGKRIAFQGVILTLLILVALGIAIQGIAWEVRIR